MQKDNRTSRRFDELLRLFEPIPSNEGPHFVDDPELVYLWSIGDLPRSEMREIAEHLAQCGHCQAEIAEMVQSGAISLETQEAKDLPLAISRKAKRRHFSFRVLITACAVGVLGIVLGLNYFDRSRSEQIAQNIPPATPHCAAIDELWLIRSPENAPVVKSAGSEPVADSGGGDDRYDFSSLRSVPQSQRNTAAYRVAYGQFLYHDGRDGAAEQFEKALALDENSVEAVLGLGLTAYAEKDHSAALRRFDSLADRTDLTPVMRFIVEYNSAKAASQLEKWDTAKSHWQNAQRLLGLAELADRPELQSLSGEIDNELELFGAGGH